MNTGDEVQLVAFKVAGQDFAFNIFHVERILRHEAPVPLPKAPAFLEGVLRYQGTAVPVIDLRKRLGVPAAVKNETRIVILDWDLGAGGDTGAESAAGAGRIGVIVDAVTEVLELSANEITPPPKIVRGLAAEYIGGLITREGRTIIVLNTPQILTSQEQLALAAAGPLAEVS